MTDSALPAAIAKRAAGSATGQCTCPSAADCAGVGGTCSNSLCGGQSATICMPSDRGGRIWGRTGCSTVNGAFRCQTVDPGDICKGFGCSAAPTAYSYQFGDPSSSFQCSDASGEVNYLVTFCPSGTTAAAVRRR